jgi:hypothetical protein
MRRVRTIYFNIIQAVKNFIVHAVITRGLLIITWPGQTGAIFADLFDLVFERGEVVHVLLYGLGRSTRLEFETDDTLDGHVKLRLKNVRVATH